MKDRDIHFTDAQGNEYFVMVREEKVEVWRNKERIHDVRFYDDELTEEGFHNRLTNKCKLQS